MALPTLFTPAAQDQSLTYLYGIFGTVNGVISSPSGSTTGTMITLLGSMFAKFNAIMLAVGVLIVVYTTVVGIMNTAHEGQFMGKNWNNLWIPIRTVMGVAALVPTASGFSGLQIVMMWVIVQGIGAADTLWTTAILYKSEHGSIYAKVGVPTLEVKNSVKGLFQGLVCAKSAAATYAKPIANDDDIKYFCTGHPDDEFCKKVSFLNSPMFAPPFTDPGATEYSLGPSDNVCGTLTYCNERQSCAADENTLACKTCRIQKKVLKDSVPVLADLAEKYVQIDHEYLVYWGARNALVKTAKALKVLPGAMPKIPAPKFVLDYCNANNNPGCVNLPPSPIEDVMSAPDTVIKKIYWEYALKPDLGDESDFIKVIVNNYAGEVNQVVGDYVSSLNTKSDKKLSGQLKAASDAGWIVAGSYYFVLSAGNANNLAAMMPITTYAFNSKKLPNARMPLLGYRNNYLAGGNLVCLAQGGSNCGSVVNEAIAGPANGAGDAINIYVQGLEATDTDPLVTLMATGSMYMNIAEAIFWIFFALTLVLAIVAIISSLNILGSGIAGIISLVLEIILMLGPLVMALIGWLLGLGATLAVYVPLIPFMIFTVGAIGWMISTVEAMVAGPLVAIGIISPSGQHEVLGKAEPALGLLFTIFLRPSLMIFGMFGGMLLSAQVMKMGNAGFAMISSTANLSGGGMFKAIIVMGTHVTFDVAIMNKTFSVIYIIPERVMSWISIQAPHEGAGELGELKGGIDKAASDAASLGKGMMDSATKAKGVSGAIDKVKEMKKAEAELQAQGLGDGKEGPQMPTAAEKEEMAKNKDIAQRASVQAYAKGHAAGSASGGGGGSDTGGGGGSDTGGGGGSDTGGGGGSDTGGGSGSDTNDDEDDEEKKKKEEEEDEAKKKKPGKKYKYDDDGSIPM